MNPLFRRLSSITALLLLLAQPAVASDFIDDMPPLDRDPDRIGAMIWEKPGFDRASYTRVMIEPITIFISPDSEYKGLDAAELKELADSFHETAIKTLEPEVPVVSQGGEGVLYIRAALTNVKLKKKKRGLLGYTPIGLVATAVKGGTGVSLKDAELEIETLDSVTGERLGVLVDVAPKAAGEKLSWESIEKTFGYYAERFKSRLQAAQ
ncbi:DUF3313 domain-containing protein [Marinobacterium arenosum]|uniref:DUF3313 domain-containing protein n=1 Tax=Marinobacterium arenosum TaxID=2862496 RepID=UPI001C953780|nr:DUF3313 domain-containing protein [Marinobacterium arenosum]MBY4679146.1 DUF3313 domain-containing protein [Marinobacterium arenosum]